MKDLYNSFLTLKAGSAKAIEATVTDLYNALDGISATAEKTVASAIKTAILMNNAFCVVTASDSAYPYTLSFGYQTGYADNFPTNLGLPEGSVQVDGTAKVDGTAGTFVYVEGNYGGFASSAPALNSYVYPAALWYYANSTLKCSNTSQLANYTQGATDVAWASFLTSNYTAGSSVTVGTRSIAMVNRIKYGVGRLESAVYFTTATVQDNNPEFKDNQGVTIGSPVTIDPTDGFPITGILVGGQKSVNWDFTPTTADGATEYSIYDTSMNSGFAAKIISTADKTTASKNSTLVLETDATEVLVALELENNTGRVIYGIGEGLIPAGAKFYLIGKLDMNANSGVTHNGATKLFQQAFVTNAYFRISSLKNAYNTLPDLRTTQLELGLSVDLTWSAGYSFDVTID